MNYKSENEELDKFRTDIILADKDSGKLVSNTSSASSTWYFHFLKRRWMNVIRILINGFMF